MRRLRRCFTNSYRTQLWRRSGYQRSYLYANGFARKIGKLNGWKDDDNPYILGAEGYDIESLRQIDEGFISGLLYTKPDKNHEISWEFEITCEFYDYWGLYFALRDIFHHYSVQKEILKREYRKLLKAKKQGLEVAA